MGNLIVGVLLAGAIILIVRKMIQDKKNGKTCCGGNCEKCHKRCG